MPSCCVPGCPKRTSKGVRIYMACFPKNPERKKVWIANIGKVNWKSTIGLCVCEIHFANEMWEKIRVDGKKKLKSNAVPTIFGAQLEKNSTFIRTNDKTIESFTRQPAIETSNEDKLQEDCSIANVFDVPLTSSNVADSSIPIYSKTICNEELNEIKQLKKQLEEANRKLDLANKIILKKSSLKQIFNDDQIEVLMRGSSRGYTWSNDTLKKALRLKFSCGCSGYQELLKEKWPLPSERTLRRKLRSIYSIMGSDHDQTFLHILRDEKNINNFLDAFFGFLYRCTDFYVETNLEQKLGFPPGMAEKLVLNTMYKWKNIASSLQKTPSVNDNTNSSSSMLDQSVSMQNKNCRLTSPVAQEIEIDSCNESETNPIKPSSMQSLKTDHISDSYNGAVRENYVWTQTLGDLDVLVKIPEHIKASKDTIKVDLSSNKIKIKGKPSASSADSEWETIFSGTLSFKIRRDESIWSIEAGKQISIHLEKAVERWWEGLVNEEPKIDLNKIDCTKHFDDMAPEEQMKVQELMWNHQQKMLGKPTSEQIKMEATLKQAWNAKGSPFQGMPYDPSILKYN
ncbi:nudC domain-containing protein 3 isoform X2 [Monomorium pharaonis]|uniref:nudC domain-containing protein 3 isoform X2 n=1 Tax=Monomorium pharaonis TaxID=307658 RepID=UPI001746BD53|nr:nudC domain-containing protein 3 isoform X2 [Monomorium pharaonis]